MRTKRNKLHELEIEMKAPSRHQINESLATLSKHGFDMQGKIDSIEDQLAGVTKIACNNTDALFALGELVKTLTEAVDKLGARLGE